MRKKKSSPRPTLRFGHFAHLRGFLKVGKLVLCQDPIAGGVKLENLFNKKPQINSVG